jgi:hypothetical protein
VQEDFDPEMRQVKSWEDQSKFITRGLKVQGSMGENGFLSMGLSGFKGAWEFGRVDFVPLFVFYYSSLSLSLFSLCK